MHKFWFKGQKAIRESDGTQEQRSKNSMRVPFIFELEFFVNAIGLDSFKNKK